jgi:leucyl aminopeptidase
MKFSLSTQDFHLLDVDLLAVPVFEGEDPSGLDEATGALLARITKEESFEGKRDSKLVIAPSGLKATRVLAVGMGKRAAAKTFGWRSFAGAAAKLAQKVSARRLGLLVPDAEAVRFAAEGVLLGTYQFDAYKSEPAKRHLGEVVLRTPTALPNNRAIADGEAAAQAVIFARDLINEPAFTLTPTAFAQRAAKMAEEVGLEAKILGPKECAEQKMGLFLAVAQGSQEEPRFLHFQYRPAGAQGRLPKLAFVGKGVTFDSGGLSLKPAKSMVGMQYDMSGAAAVMGAMRAIAQLKLPVEIHGITPLTENMPSGTAYRPSDVVRGMSGKTVEVLNTDAEGRLILADALWYASRLKPDAMIDLATLTGACIVALGNTTAGAFGSDKGLLDRVLAAAEAAGEDFWPMPLPEKMRGDLKGDVGDLRNVTGEPAGGAIIGGLFLQEFTDGLPWVHLDIAGPAHAEKPTPITPKGGTGFGVLTLIELARRAANGG